MGAKLGELHGIHWLGCCAACCQSRGNRSGNSSLNARQNFFRQCILVKLYRVQVNQVETSGILVGGSNRVASGRGNNLIQSAATGSSIVRCRSSRQRQDTWRAPAQHKRNRPEWPVHSRESHSDARVVAHPTRQCVACAKATLCREEPTCKCHTWTARVARFKLNQTFPVTHL
jgi:hypothetical protein